MYYVLQAATPQPMPKALVSQSDAFLEWKKFFVYKFVLQLVFMFMFVSKSQLY